MKLLKVVALCVVGAVTLSGCDKLKKSDVTKTIDGVNVIDATNLNDIMLTVADPNEAVTYFQRALSKKPERTDFQRGLAKSLVRSGRATEAVLVFEPLVKSKDVTNEDHIDYADALIRTGNWKGAEAQLAAVPPTYETYGRYRLEAMVADSNKQWKKADSFYEIASGLTTRPAAVLNNWGYSKMTRGHYKAAEKLFVEAVSDNPKMFTAKNNLVLARGAQKNYTLPIIRMTQVEKAELLHTLAISAIKQGDITIGRSLLQDAIDTNPRHFEAAIRTLEALDAKTSS